MTEARGETDFRVQLAQEVEKAVERAGHFMGASREICLRAKDVLVLYMLGRFREAKDLDAVQAWSPFLAKAASRTLRREMKTLATRAEVPLSQAIDRLETSLQEDPGEQVLENHEYLHLMAKVNLGLKSLTQRERKVLELRMNGLANETIAGILGITRESVYAHGTSGIAKLRLIYRDAK